MEIYPNVHHIPGVTANSYLLIDPRGLALVDAGLPGSHRKILHYLDHLGLTPYQLKYLLITHADYDHVGGLAALQKISGARVYASAIEAAAMAEGRPSRVIPPSNSLLKRMLRWLSRFGRTARVSVDVLVTDGLILPILAGMQVLDTKGHTPGHVSYFLREAGLLFSGDSIVSVEGRLFGSRPALTWDRQQADLSVRKQADLGASLVCPGHGPVVKDAQDKFPDM